MKHPSDGVDLIEGILFIMQYENEIWKVLTGISENHAISNYGRKKYIPKNRITNGMERYDKRKGRGDWSYTCFEINGKEYCTHRLVALYFIPNSDTIKNHVNHIDGNTFNNCVSNLEWCSTRENLHYRFRKNRNEIKSKYIGVRPYQLKKGIVYGSQISINGKTKNLGTYNTEIEAYEAYKKKCIEIGREILTIK